MQTKIYLLILFGFILLMISCKKAESESDWVPLTKFDPARNASVDLQAAIAEAKRSDRRIMLDVGGEWCIWCHRLDEFIKNDVQLDTFLKSNFVVLKVNYSKENKNEAFLAQYPKVPGYPHLFVLEKDGSFLYSQGTAELEQDKSYNHQKLMDFFQKWAPQN